MKRIHKYNIGELSGKAYQAPSLREGRGGCGSVGSGCASNGSSTNCVCECNRAFRAETLHPLVSLIDTSAPCDGGHFDADCYAVSFRHRACDSEKYGRKYYDFSDMTVLFTAPHKGFDLATDNGKMLVFQPALAECTPLGAHLNDYTFFKYRPNEALHLSHCEEKVAMRCLDAIGDELCWGVDEYSKGIISNIIDLLLSYCRRFYNRQFITRHNANTDSIAAFDGIADQYLRSGQAATRGLPTRSFFAKQLDMSAEYLDDMLKNETGKTVSEYIQLRRMSIAKQLLMGTGMTTSAIAETLGFSTEGCFATVFKKTTGCTPDEYRRN